jgi:tRNA-binding EMAP/Myf-like protein
MKISLNWLKTLLPLTQTPEEIEAILTATGLEVEHFEYVDSIKGGLRGLVVGEVKTCVKHPNADKLNLTTVDIGQENLLNIVCGAPNVAAGQKVIVAPVGTLINPSSGEPFTIQKAKIRGEQSEGMLCAEDEIGLGASHAGLLILPDHLELGSKLSDRAKCFDCHFSPDFTGDEFKNIGLYDGLEWNDKGRFAVSKDSNDLGKFKVPGLRNIAITGPYMHNGKFKTLEEVIEYYSNPYKTVKQPINMDPSLVKAINFSDEEKLDLLNFLKSLTDKQFLNR